MSRVFEGVSGASETKAVVESEVLNKAITDILIKNAQLCDKTGKIIQKINTCRSADNINIPGGIKQQAALVILQACSQDAEATSKISNEIANAVDAQAKAGTASGAGLLFNGLTSNSSEIKTKVTNDIQNTIKMVTEQSCNIVTGVDQSVEICGSNINIGSIDQTAAIEVSGGCDQVSKTINDFSNRMSTAIKATASSGSDLMAGIVAIVFLFVIMGIIAAIIYSGGGKRRRRPMSNRMVQVDPSPYMQGFANMSNVGQGMFDAEGQGEARSKQYESPELHYDW
jgi:hypothetical protein